MVPKPTWADEPSATELAVARRLFKEATELEREEKWDLAIAKLREAILIKDTPGLRFHLAYCEERLGRLVEAMLDYDRARELLNSGMRAPDVQELLEPARRDLEQRLPTLLISTPSDIPGVRVELNGKVLAPAVVGRAAPVNPGKYHVVVTASGHEPFVRDLVIRQTDRRQITVTLKPLKSAPASTVDEPSASGGAPHSELPAKSEGSDNDTRTYVLVAESAVTVGALGFGIGYLLVKNAKQTRAMRAQETIGTRSCRPPIEDATLLNDCRALHDATSDYDQARLLSTIGFIGAGVGAASIALTIALWPNGSTTRVAVVPQREGLMLNLRSAF